MNNNSCRSCNTNTSRNRIKQTIKELVAAIWIEDSERAPPEVYDKRVSACRTCRFLREQTTCGQCGCFVEIRALYKKQYCPAPEENRWT